MAKRFTDSEKWKNPWFRTLPSAYRWLWVYMLDNCDAAGIWMVDFSTASHFIGESIDHDMAKEIFGDKIVEIGFDKWFIPSFITFQYGKLKSDSRPHQSVIKILEKFEIDPNSLTVSKGYPKSIHTLKDKEQDKDKDKIKEQDKEKKLADSILKHEIKKAVEIIYSNFYPRKEGKAEGVKKACRDIQTEADLLAFETAVIRYKDHCAKNGTDPKYIKHFSSFVTSWREWLDPETGTASVLNPVESMLAEMQQLIEEGA